jgi:acid phosphatase
VATDGSGSAGASLQAYKLAALKLDQALRAPSWTASLEQAAAGAPSYARLPPAIVFDVDETVLSNAPYNAWMVLNNRSYDEATWRRWVEEARATAVPGALAFARYAQKKGVAVFYISNRGRRRRSAQRAILKRLGLPAFDAFRSNSVADDKPGWGSDKASRRRAVARTHRILLLIVDDFNDFVSGAKSLLPQRSKLHARYSHLWGEKVARRPNPRLRSWDAALTPTEGVDSWRANTSRCSRHRSLRATSAPEAPGTNPLFSYPQVLVQGRIDGQEGPAKPILSRQLPAQVLARPCGTAIAFGRGMSHSLPGGLSLDGPSGADFEAQVRAPARTPASCARSCGAKCARPSTRPLRTSPAPTPPTARIRVAREKLHARKWKRAAAAAAALAFAGGVLWPVSQAPEDDSPSSPASRLVRTFSGDVLASLERPAPRAN